jgi:hypothetical protein
MAATRNSRARSSRNRQKVFGPVSIAGAAIVSLLAVAGCATAVGAGAGAATAIAYSDRGAKGEIQGDVERTRKTTELVFKEMGIHLTDTAMKDQGREQELKGNSSSGNITVTITPSGRGVSHIEVIARERTLKWNKDYAKTILSKIASKG